MHAVGHIGLLLQVGFDALARLFGILARALVDEHLLHDLIGGVLVLDQVGREALLKEGSHGLLDKAVVDGLLGLVFVGRLGGEAVGHQHQTVLDVLPLNAALVFVVLALLLDVGIDGASQSATSRFLRRATVLEPGGVVVVLLHLEGAREAHACGDLYVVVGQVLAVATAAVGLDKEGLGKVVGTDLLEHIVLDALGIAEVLFGKLAIVALDTQTEGHVGVDHGLAAHGLAIPIVGNADGGKDLKIGAPLDGGTGAVLVCGLDLECLLFGADDLAFLKVQRVLVAVAPNRDVHVLGGVLGRARAQAVGAQREVVVAALVVVVLAAGIELAKDELPVKALLGGVPVERAAAAVVLYLNRTIAKGGEGDELAVALARLVNGVGQDLEGGMRATVESVRAKDDGGAQAYALLVLELADTVVTIVCGVFCHARSLDAPLLRCSHIDSQGSIAQASDDSN